MGRGIRLPLVPAVLEWAIRESGYTPEQLADKVKGIEPDDIDGWLHHAGEGPTLTQARKLARVLRRPLAALLLPAPPTLAPPTVEFRAPIGAARRELTPDERVAVRAAGRIRRALAWLHEELAQGTPDVPEIGRSTAPEQAAEQVRRALGVSAEAQQGWNDASHALKAWRAAVESLGIHVFLRSLGRDGIRGFSLWHARVPVAVVSTAVSREAMTFTLLHELAHLLRRSDSACLVVGAGQINGRSEPEERWCDRFAAAALLPWDAVLATLRSIPAWRQDAPVTDLHIPERVARRMKASLRATVLRFIDRKIAGWALYQAIPSTSDDKPTGGGGGTPEDTTRRRLRQYGARTAGLFVTAMREGVLAPTEVMDYLDVGYAELETLSASADAV